MARLSVCLLGPFQVTLDGKPVAGLRSDKVRALLAYLAVEAKGPHRREKLAGLLWPDQPEQSARANLRRALANLRQVIHDHQATPPFLLISRQTIQFNDAGDAWVDVAAFTELLETKGPPQPIHRLEEAVEWYRGSFLEGFSISNSSAFEEWALLNRERLHRLVLDVLRRVAEAHKECGEYERALQYTWRQVGLDPWREKAHQQLMQLLALSGQRRAALTQYETYRRLLAEELGVEPAAETTRLYEQIRDEEIKGPETPLTPPFEVSAQPPSFLDEKKLVEIERPVFVGRERELERMNRFLETALGGGGRVIFVTGDAGRGKTTLLDEFARRAQDMHADLLVATGNCNAYSGVGDPYLPFRDVLAMLTGDVEAKWATGAISRDHACRLWEMAPHAAHMLMDRGPELIGIFLSGRELVTRSIAAVPGGAGWLNRLKELAEREKAGPSGLEQGQLFEQYANVLRGLAAQRPLLIVLDDLQWADDASISLLFHLGRRIEGSRILIAGAYRPDEVALERDGGRHPLETLLAEFKRYFGDVWVNLAETEEAEARRFVDALLSTKPNRLGEDFRQALFGRTGGHPMFTVELIREMVERGNLVRDEQGRWIEKPVLDWAMLPARVEGVIEERIGRLEPELRETLSVASVEGEEFTAQVVARVQQVDERRLLRALSNELEKRHCLIREREEVQVGGRHLSRYRFAHVLFQQYLYHSLGTGERRLLHREIAAALEELYKGRTREIAVQLVHHYAGDPERERHYAKLAGERAAAQFANAEALRYLSRALDLTPEGDTAERYALLLTREKVFDLQGERKAQKQDLAALESLADGQQQAAKRRAEVALRQARYAEAIGDYPATIAAAQIVIGSARAIQDMANGSLANGSLGNETLANETLGREAAGYLQWGRALWRQGEYKAARLQFEQALNLARAAGARQLEADCLRSIGLVSWLQDDYAGAKAYPEQALRIYRELGNRRSESMALNSLGVASSEQGDHIGAGVYLEQTLRIAREIGDRRSEGRALGNIGLVYAELGDYAEARDYFEQSLHIKTAIGDREGICGTLSNLGLLSHHEGDYETSQEHSQQALLVAQEIGSRRWQGYALTNRGRALEGLGRLAEAAESYRQALTLRRELGQHRMAMDALAGLARISLAQDDLAQAQASVEEILSCRQRNIPSLPAADLRYGIVGAEEPFQIYLTCYRVLRASLDPRAETILDAAHRLLQEQAAKISDEELRRSFLEQVNANRDIIKAWESRSR